MDNLPYHQRCPVFKSDAARTDKDYRRARAELYRLAGVNFPLHNGIFQEYVLAQKNNGTLFNMVDQQTTTAQTNANFLQIGSRLCPKRLP